MFSNRKLPDDFIEKLKSLEKLYLKETDPIRQSGFGGGVERWHAEREPILDAIDINGDFLDIGCANGYLLECLIKWGRARGILLKPFGLDFGSKLIELARERFPNYQSNFFVGNGWDWQPNRRFQYVYTLYDCVPKDYLKEYFDRLLSRILSPGGRLIIGAYGSKTKNITPFDIKNLLIKNGFTVAGNKEVGTSPVSSFAWVDK